MGSQAVEILRQGVWASLTGGWCFDPHQSIFCNTFHLYVWLFLLCLPFAVYLYFPPTLLVWSVYCGIITLLFGVLRLVTYQLHTMFDTTEPTIDLKATDVSNNPFQEHTTHREEEGIEMQVLRKVPTSGTGQAACSSHTSYSGSDGPIAGSNESIPFWTDYSHTGLKSTGSTNDIKVDVEGKENSERSDEFSGSRTFAEAGTVGGGVPSSRLVRSRPLRRRPGHSQADSKGGEGSQKDAQNYACSSNSAVGNYEARESSSNQLSSKEDPSNPSVVVAVEYGPLERKEGPSRRFPQSTNGSLSVLPTSTVIAAQTIKPTGSLELGNNMDVDQDKGLLFWKQHKCERGSGQSDGVRRIRSSALDSSTPSGSSRNADNLPSPTKSQAARYEPKASTSKRDSDDEDSNAGSHSPLLLMKNKRLGGEEKKTSKDSSPSDTTESATSIDKDKKTACECGGSEIDDILASNNSLEAAAKALSESQATLDYTRKQIELAPSDAEMCVELLKDVERIQALAESKLDRSRRRSSDLSSTHESSTQPNTPLEAAVSRFWPAGFQLDPLIRNAVELQEPSDMGAAAMQRLILAATQASETAGGDSKLEAVPGDGILLTQRTGVSEVKTETGTTPRANQDSSVNALKALSKKWKALSSSTGGAAASGGGDGPPPCSADSPPSSALPSPVSFDWLYKRADSETEKSLGNQSRDLGQWNYTHSDDSDSSVSLPMHPRQDKDSCNSVGSSSSNSGTSQEMETKSLLVRNNNKGTETWNRLAVQKRRYKAGAARNAERGDYKKRSSSAAGESGNSESLNFQHPALTCRESRAASKHTAPPEPVLPGTPVGNNNNNNNSELLEAIVSYLLNRVNNSLATQAEASTSSAPPDPSSPPPPPPPPPPLPLPVYPPSASLPSTSPMTLGASHEQQRHDRRRERRKHHRLKRSTRMHRSRAHVRTRPSQDPMPAGASAASTVATSTSTATCASTSRGTSSAVVTAGTSTFAICGPQDSEMGEACALDSSNAPLASMLGLSGAHLAASHDDTSDGALHFFKDEHGKVMTYVFDVKGSSESHLPGVSLPANNSTFLQSMLRLQKRRRRSAKRYSVTPGSTDQTPAQVSVSPSCPAPCASTLTVPVPTLTLPTLTLPTLTLPTLTLPTPSLPMSSHALSSPSLALRPRDFSTTIEADSDTLSSSPSVTSYDVNVSVESGTKSGTAAAAAGTSDGTGDISPPYVLPASTPPPPCCHRRSQRAMRPVLPSTITPVFKSTPLGAAQSTESSSDPLQAAVTQMISTIQSRQRMESLDRYRYQDRRRSRPQTSLRSHALEILLNDNLFRDIELRLERYEQFEQSLEARRSQQTLERSSSMFAEQMSSVLQPYDGVLRPVSHSPKYYKYRIAPHIYFKVHLDRLELLAMLDRTVTVWETLLSVILSVLVAICGAQLLRSGYYRDIMAFLLCFTIAGCQYSLLKSVQPDAASPTHGHNRLVAYSRPAYFCLCSMLIFALESQLSPTISKAGVFNFNAGSTVQIYGMTVDPVYLTWRLRKFFADLLLFFPIVFSFGLFPQVNTFSLYFLEQVDMHVFGGNASSSLGASIFCVFRSIIAVIVLMGFAFGGLSRPKAQQHLLFSLFCGLLVAIAFHLSRCASDPAPIWCIFKSHCRPPLDLSSLCERGTAQKRPKERRTSKKKHRKEKRSVRCAERVGASTKADNKSATGSSTISNPSFCTNKTSSDPQDAPSLPSNEPLLEGGGDESCSRASNPTQQTSAGASASVSSPATATSPAPAPAPAAAAAQPAEPVAPATDPQEQPAEQEKELVDPLPQKLMKTVWMRIKSDMVVCILLTIFVFGIHCSTVFTTLQPHLNYTLWAIATCLGFLIHYIMPHLRKQLPWLCLARPVFRSYEFNQFETKEAARIMWFEKLYVYLCFFERNVLYPAVILGAVTWDAPRIVGRLGPIGGALVVSVCALKCLRCCYSDATPQYLVLVFAVLFFQLDFASASESFLVDYFVMGILFSKAYEFLLKVQFVVTYIAPWQITWGSAFHAFAQPFSVPHSAMLFAQAAISAIMSSPLSPFLGSAIFLTSYVRPVKFWERDYNTRRVDHSNARLSSLLERNLGSDDNNLNSIFYEHLTRSLQHSLCGDLMMGRWGPVSQGDCFVLASENLNCLVHIVEMGNGLVTFQMRGLEFRGTYCQQREVEAITEEIGDNSACCCCCQPGHLPHVLSVNAAFSQRWLAWEVTATKYVLEGYSISVNNAISTLQTFDLRKVLVTYYVKSIIFYAVRSSKLEEWLSSPTILEALKHMWDRSFVDLDPVFSMNIDEDFDLRTSGITYSSFCSVYLDWILFCVGKREKVVETCTLQLLVTLCLALSLLGRRALGAASHNYNGISSVDFFLHGLHALFKGDFRITCVRDEWIFSDMELMRRVVAPAIRMSLKLHLDHFMSSDEYDDPTALFNAITSHEESLVISHEGDPVWRNAVLAGTPSLLSLRHVSDEGKDLYRVIMLNKRFLSFRVIKMNRECVRGLWAGQQQELVYLRNRNPERGSIQNAKQALRNIINSSCDQPIGYPIYVSPLTTSYADTNEQLTSLVGGPLSLGAVKNAVIRAWQRIHKRCGEGCASGGAATSTATQDDNGFAREGYYAMTTFNMNSATYSHQSSGHNTSGSQSMDSAFGGRSSSLNRSAVPCASGTTGGTAVASASSGVLGGALGNRGSLSSVHQCKTGNPTLASLANLLSSSDNAKLQEHVLNIRESVREREREEERQRENIERERREEATEPVQQRVRIVDPNQVYDAINMGRRIDVVWPDEWMRQRGGRSHWRNWLPEKGMEGQVVHRWVPCHRDPNYRSHVDRTILLVKIEDKFVPIAESGVQDLGAEV